MEEKKDNQTESTVKYTGEVKVSVIKKKPIKTIKRHNDGGDGLFTCITKALATEGIARYLPRYIVCYTKNGNTYQRVSTPISYSSSPTRYLGNNTSPSLDSGESNKTQLQFLIPYSSFTVEVGDVVTVDRMYLINEQEFSMGSDYFENHYCAVVDFDDNSKIEVDSDTNLLIYWSLSFGN